MEWVAVMTFVDEHAGMFYEAGGIYDHQPCCKSTAGARPLDPGEPIAVCPRCGQRFAGAEESSPEANRDLHFEGGRRLPFDLSTPAGTTGWADDARGCRQEVEIAMDPQRR